jgi:hypothetical protein
MKLVAFDYLTKPFGNDELLLVDSCALDDFQLRHEARRLRGELARSYGLPNIIAADPKMIAVLDLMNSIVQTSRYFFRPRRRLSVCHVPILYKCLGNLAANRERRLSTSGGNTEN